MTVTRTPVGLDWYWTCNLCRAYKMQKIEGTPDNPGLTPDPPEGWVRVSIGKAYHLHNRHVCDKCADQVCAHRAKE